MNGYKNPFVIKFRDEDHSVIEIPPVCREYNWASVYTVKYISAETATAVNPPISLTLAFLSLYFRKKTEIATPQMTDTIANQIFQFISGEYEDTSMPASRIKAISDATNGSPRIWSFRKCVTENDSVMIDDSANASHCLALMK